MDIKYRHGSVIMYVIVFFLVVFSCLAYRDCSQNALWEAAIAPKRLVTPQVEEMVYLPVEIETKSAHSLMSSSIQSKFQEVGSPLADRIPWLLSECEFRGLNPELVAAVMAKESGWGRNCYAGNCFGYGLMDSGNLPEWYGGSFEEITVKILDAYEVHYNVDTAEEMAARGYNSHQEWIHGVNLIMSYF